MTKAELKKTPTLESATLYEVDHSGSNGVVLTVKVIANGSVAALRMFLKRWPYVNFVALRRIGTTIYYPEKEIQ